MASIMSGNFLQLRLIYTFSCQNSLSASTAPRHWLHAAGRCNRPTARRASAFDTESIAQRRGSIRVSGTPAGSTAGGTGGQLRLRSYVLCLSTVRQSTPPPHVETPSGLLEPGKQILPWRS